MPALSPDVPCFQHWSTILLTTLRATLRQARSRSAYLPALPAALYTAEVTPAVLLTRLRPASTGAEQAGTYPAGMPTLPSGLHSQKAGATLLLTALRLGTRREPGHLAHTPGMPALSSDLHPQAAGATLLLAPLPAGSRTEPRAGECATQQCGQREAAPRAAPAHRRGAPFLSPERVRRNSHTTGTTHSPAVHYPA